VSEIAVKGVEGLSSGDMSFKEDGIFRGGKRRNIG
jgi:hypothetical protein